MNKIERRLRELASRLTTWWGSSAKNARERGSEGTAGLRREASARAKQAASAARDFRESERGQRAASKLSDLRKGEAAKKAEAALNDLRKGEAAKKAEAALSDLRQRESVKKAEESARKVVHDLFSGSGTGSSGSGPAAS